MLTATTDALIGCAGLDAYTAAKGGVVAVTRSFAAGIAPDGVRVNAICPSFVSSEPQQEWLADEDSRAARRRTAPAADSVARRRSRRSSSTSPPTSSRAMTGTVIPIDSGYMAFKANLDIVGAMRVDDDEADVVARA